MGTDPLTYDVGMEADAQAWANHLITINTLQHASNTGLGENLYKFSTSSPTGVATCDDAVTAWYVHNYRTKYAFTSFSQTPQ